MKRLLLAGSLMLASLWIGLPSHAVPVLAANQTGPCFAYNSKDATQVTFGSTGSKTVHPPHEGGIKITITAKAGAKVCVESFKNPNLPKPPGSKGHSTKYFEVVVKSGTVLSIQILRKLPGGPNAKLYYYNTATNSWIQVSGPPYTIKAGVVYALVK